MNYRGFFLNLQRNEERRQALVKHLEGIGAAEQYERFEAVNGHAAATQHQTQLDPGNLGLWLSHERLLTSLKSSKEHVHILEDDAILGKNAVEILDQLLVRMDQELPKWDLLFTDIFVQPRNDVFRELLVKMRDFARSGSYAIVDLLEIEFASTTSLLINKSSIEKYLALITGKWALGFPIDIYLRSLIRNRNLNAYVTVPFITSISSQSNRSTIRDEVDRSRRVCDTLRRGMFPEADLQALQQEMMQLTAGAKVSALTALYLNAEMFTLSDQLEDF